MSKDEFIEEYSRFGHRTDARHGPGLHDDSFQRWNLDKVHEYFDAVACDCGAPECQGWKMHIKEMEPPPDCGKDPMTWKLPFGPPFTMMEDDDMSLIPGGLPSDTDTVLPNVSDDEPGFGGSSPPSGIVGSPNTGLASKEPIGLPRSDIPFNWTFVLDGNTVGELYYDDKTKKLDFSGNVHASAQILFDLLSERFETWHKEKYGE